MKANEKKETKLCFRLAKPERMAQAVGPDLALPMYREALPMISEADVNTVFFDSRIKVVEDEIFWQMDDQNIKIGGIEYKANTLRNSLKHTRTKDLVEAKKTVSAGLESDRFGAVQDGTFIVRAVPWMERSGFHVHLIRIIRLDADVTVTEHNRFSFCMEVQNHKNNVFAEIYGITGRRGYLVRHHNGADGEDHQKICRTVMEVKNHLSQLGYVELDEKTVDIDEI